MATGAMINTKKVQGRRALAFASLDAVVADAEMLVNAEESGRLRALGNWTVGQACGHLSTWINFALDGYPPELRPPWIVKVLVKPLKGKLLSGKMPVGVRIRKFPEGTLGDGAACGA
jgi:hypothetical protein